MIGQIVVDTKRVSVVKSPVWHFVLCGWHDVIVWTIVVLMVEVLHLCGVVVGVSVEMG